MIIDYSQNYINCSDIVILGLGLERMTVLDFVTVDNNMLQYWLLLLVLIWVEGIKIEKEVGFAELRESHGWYLLGGVSLSEGKVMMSSKIELYSTLREDKEYNMEIVLMNGQELSMQMSQRCVQNSKNEIRTIVNTLQRQKGGNYVAQNEKNSNQRNDQFLFVVMRDCKNTLVKQFFQKGQLRVQVNIFNNDSHIPQTQHKRQLASLLSVFVLVFLIRRTSKRLGKYDYDSVTFLIFAFLLLQLLAALTSESMLICRIIKGNHSFTLDFAKIIFHSLSQTLLIYTFYNIALGWTVRTETLVIFKYLQQKIFLFLIVFASQITAYLYQGDLMYYEWAKNISGIITTLAIFVFFILILVKLKGADIKIVKLYVCMLLIATINTVAVPQFSLLLQRMTLYSYKIEIQTLETFLSTLSAILLYITFIGPSSIYYKNCLKYKSFMD